MSEPTLGEILAAVQALNVRMDAVSDSIGNLREDLASMRRAVLDELAALRRRVEALDRDIDTLFRTIDGGEG